MLPEAVFLVMDTRYMGKQLNGSCLAGNELVPSMTKNTASVYIFFVVILVVHFYFTNFKNKFIINFYVIKFQILLKTTN